MTLWDYIAKLLLQNLWKLQISRYEELTPDIFETWTSFQRNLVCINKLKLPRHSILSDYIIIELRVFADSSDRAYSACLYIRSELSSS